MRCKSCEREVKSDFKYCPYCAARLIHDFGDHYEELEPAYVLPPEAEREDPAAVLYGQPQEEQSFAQAAELQTPPSSYEPKNLHATEPLPDLPVEEEKPGDIHFSTSYLKEDDLYFEDLPEDAFSTRQPDETLFKEMSGYQVFQPKAPLFQLENSFSLEPPLAAAEDVLQEVLRPQEPPKRMIVPPEPPERKVDASFEQHRSNVTHQEELSDELLQNVDDFILPDETFDQLEPAEWEKTSTTQQYPQTFRAHLPRELEDEETSAFSRHPDHQAPYAGSPRARGYAAAHQSSQDDWAEEAPYVPLEPDNAITAVSENRSQPSAGDVFFKLLLILFLLSAGTVLSILIFYFCNTPDPFKSFSLSALLAAWLR